MILETRSTDRARADHEAGHVVAAKLLGWVAEQATIDGPETCIEHLVVAVTEPQSDRRRAFRRLLDLRQFMTIVFAGPARERTTQDADREDFVAGVIAAAKGELGTLLSDDELEGILRGAAAASERIVNHRLTADALVAVSDALVDRRTLTARELGELLGPLLPAYREFFEGAEWTVTIGGSRER